MSALGNPSYSPSPVPPGPVVSPAPAAPPPASKRWVWYLAGALVIGGIAGWLALGRQTGQQAKQSAAEAAVKTAKITKGSLLQTVRVSGLTASRSFVNITAPIQRGPESGPMVLLYLTQSGTRVKKGDMVAQIDSKSVEDHVDDIEADITQADADIRKRQAEQAVDLENLNSTIRQAKAANDKAQLDAKASEVRTDVERELLKLAAEEAAARYKQVQSDTQQKLAGYAAEIKILEITRQRHVRHITRHKNDLVRFKIFAPMDGLAVIQPMFRGGEMSLIQMGDQVGPGQLFMKVVDPTKMVIEGNINQTESSTFRLGQKANIEFDAFPGMKMTGRVYSMAALATKGWRENFYIRSLPVRVNIEGSDPKLIPDLSASADVITASIDNATLIPLGAVQSEAGKDVVYVRAAKGGFEKRTVELGERNNTHAAVKSGLEAGDEVAIEKPAVATAAMASL
jgi:multidrug efflux pump subunit AcrA (membrane-fusion protein)